MARTGIIYHDAFDALTIVDQGSLYWDQDQYVQATDLQIVSTHSRLSGNSLRAECNYAYPRSGTWRTEIMSRYTKGLNQFEHWIAFSLYVDSSYADDPVSEIFWQQHADNGNTPPLSLRNIEGQLQLRSIFGIGSEYRLEHPVGALPKGEWVDFVCHWKQSNNPAWADEDGVLRLWMNRELVVEQLGPNNYSDTTWPAYQKLGIYKSGWEDGVQPTGDSAVSQRVVYYDEYRIGDATASFRDVDPEGRAPLSGPGSERRRRITVVS